MTDIRVRTFAPSGKSSPQKTLWLALSVVRWDIVAPILVFAILVLTGITTSSLGVASLLVDPNEGAGTFGTPRPIRSDEYLTGTPLRIGWATMGGFESLNPLSANANFTNQAPSGFFSALVFFDSSAMVLGSFVPTQMLVAFYWWIPYLLVVLSLPRIFEFLTGSRLNGWLASWLIIFSPAIAWWSGSILWIIGFVGAGAAALINCVIRFEQHSYARSVSWGLTSVILLARTPFHYQPWMVVLAPIMLLMVIVPLLATRERWRTRLPIVAAVTIGSLGVFALSLLELREGFNAALGTVYPGGRRTTGGPVEVWQLFGAPQLMDLDSHSFVATNHSEVSSSYLILGVVAVIMVLTSKRQTTRSQKIAWTIVAWGTAFWFIWSVMNFGRIGASIPLVSMVAAGRAAAVIGILAVFLFAISNTWKGFDSATNSMEESGLQASMVGGFSGFALTGYAGATLQVQQMPTLTNRHIFISSLVVGILCFALLRWRHSTGVKVALLACTFALTAPVNPVQVGLGDIGNSSLSSALRTDGSIARHEGTVWATDSIHFDALLTANAVPSLSTRQMAGPNPEAWQNIDPNGAFEEAWNRGGSFIMFSWEDIPSPSIQNPNPDIINIAISPCDLQDAFPQLTTVVSSVPLQFGCLTPTSILPGDGEGVDFGGQFYFLYELVE